jgi:uncharacterized protein
VATIAVHVTPKASRDEIVGWKGAELSVRVTTAPEGGKANAAVCKVLGAALGVPKSSVRVVRGEVSRHKLLSVDGVDEEELRSLCGGPDAALF